MALVEESVGSTADLTQRVLAIAAELPPGRGLWYRGLPCSSHALVPKLYRGVDDAVAAFDRERRLAVRFRQRSLPFWSAGYPQNDWEHMFVMQHHGVPTRLLDWSENLYVGMYFALSTGPQHEHVDVPPHDGDCTPTLWVLDPIGWNETVPQLVGLVQEGSIFTTADEEIIRPYSPATNDNRLLQRHDKPMAIYGTHNTNRIVAQRGTFTIAGRSLNSLESFAAGGSPILWKLEMGLGDEALRRDLDVLGFTESMIYPDLAALARELDKSEV